MENAGDFRNGVAELWRSRSSISREHIFGPDDSLRPISNQSDVDTAAVGAMGENYIAGGLALLSVNPAGGKDDAVASKSDKEMYQLFRSLRDATPTDVALRLRQASDVVFRQMPGWTVYNQHIAPILDALARNRHDIAYIYVVPFRTRGDKAALIKPAMVDNAWREGLELQLASLKPGTIVTIDRISESIANRYAEMADHPVVVWYYTRKRDAHAERRETLKKMAELRVS